MKEDKLLVQIRVVVKLNELTQRGKIRWERQASANSPDESNSSGEDVYVYSADYRGNELTLDETREEPDVFSTLSKQDSPVYVPLLAASRLIFPVATLVGTGAVTAARRLQSERHSFALHVRPKNSSLEESLHVPPMPAVSSLAESVIKQVEAKGPEGAKRVRSEGSFQAFTSFDQMLDEEFETEQAD